MAKRSNEPFLWLLFSAGGVMSAFFAPVLLLLFALAFPLGWVEAPSHERLLALISHPLARVFLLVVCSLSLFRWAHRFRFTLYDGLQVKHLNEMINVLCYGGAVAGTAIAAYLVWYLPAM
jgi:fumarate reductase subunit D